MSMPWDRFEGPLKWLVMFVTILLVASGLCGLQLLILNDGQNGANGLASVFMITGLFELGAMAVSAVGIVVSLIAWIVRLIFPEGNST